MCKVHSIESVQKIAISLEEAWNFFSKPKNLLLITPPFLNLKEINKPSDSEAFEGQIISYSVRPLLGISVLWISEITHVQHQKMFCDNQRKGPYKLWYHEHYFKEVDGGIEMTDAVQYQVPLGMLGLIANTLFVKKQLEKIFTYRYNAIIKLFGDWPGEEMRLRIK